MGYAPKTTATRQFAGLVLARVEPEKCDALRALLADIHAETSATMRGAPPAGAIVPFHELETLHYARFVLLEGDGVTEPLLAFSTNYDGPEGDASVSASRAWSFHLSELVHKAGPGLERVFAHCRGYRAGRLERFVRAHQRRASTFYVGSSGRSRNQILWERELRRAVDRVLDQGGFERSRPEVVRSAVLAALEPSYGKIPTFPAQPDLEWRIRLAVLLLVAGVVVLAGMGVTAGLSLEWSALEWLFVVAGSAAFVTALVARFRWLELTDPQFQPAQDAATVARFETASAAENDFLQNQLTHLVPIKPGPLRWLLIRIVFLALNFLARNRYNKGKLGGIPSIHFARWVLIENRGVLFFSNFDSSWPSYLGDFIDQASNGLTGVWSNTVGYPRTTWLLQAGSRDAARFLAWTRAHQHPTNVWYAAYPGVSIVNVNANTEIRRGLADPGCLDAATWLFHLRGVDRVAADQLYGDERRAFPLPVDDIQGMILWGYGHMPEARYLLLRVPAAAATDAMRGWLADLPLTSAAGSRTEEPAEPLVNVAFTHRGLVALGVDPALTAGFSTPFVQGSEHPYRARVNGDFGESAPERWTWGSTENPVHLVLCVFAATRDGVERYAAEFGARARAAGFELVTVLEGTTLPGRKEHFGFRDGIAQPELKGSGRGGIEGNLVDAGEFLLGHRDGYGNVSTSPESTSGFAWGANGSYLVFRQLEQDVEAFWRYAASIDGPNPVKAASKMVGRWPSGAPLVRHPDADPDSPRFADDDTFTYLSSDDDNDRYGARCPFGAHIRRTNPRDWQLGETPDESLELANLHRILRRGRPYGEPLDAAMAPGELVRRSLAADPSAPRAARGLQFLCFNANIDRGFEFVQQQWSSNPKFAGQDVDPDPLFGLHREPGDVGLDAPAFTRQSDVKQGTLPRTPGLSRFVRVRGSAYFFMPSIPAVRLLAGAVCGESPAVALERVPDDEQLYIDSLIDTLRDKMRRDYAGKLTLRDAHPKMHGCVRATLRVEPDLPPELRVGVFAQPKRYPAWVRFSNASGTVASDDKKDVRGIAIKLVGVPGAKLLEGAEGSSTHDFILISTDVFVTRDVEEFSELVSAATSGSGWKALPFLLLHPRMALAVLRVRARHASPAAIRYFSVVPYLYGAAAAKYSLTPLDGPASLPPAPRSPNYLREALKTRLAERPLVFDFSVQIRSDPSRMPVEDPSVRWRERDAPFRKVATLEIPPQDFDTPERQHFAENLSYNPWRCLPEHRPLGGISRARRQVYRALSAYRHDRNAEPSEEPGTET
ncbi:MAG TPA: Dyp-type peroxidase [Polyangiaceae bacterium]|nr:Dyp-type peroxidase [Polyangiaceae bacterium]